MAESYLGVRQESLRRTQNPDGGWGYFLGKQSWLEPTAYAALVLHGEPAADRAWKLLSGWQGKDGGFRPKADVEIESWGTALWLLLASARGESGAGSEQSAAPAISQAVTWMLGVRGAEAWWLKRWTANLGLFQAERDLNFIGWPWKQDTSSWVEPTAHSIVALKRLSPKFASNPLRERLRLAIGNLMDVRCSDGGWNYGSRAALNHDLPSYPETTGLALLGLQGRTDLRPSLDLAQRLATDHTSSLARSWLAIALRLHGREAPEPLTGALPADLHEVALEALAAPEGNYKFFQTEVHA